jgi:D-sedoheptulose 7-phosphate isomerase
MLMAGKCRRKGKKIIFIGNGASASISGHMAADFSKNAGVKAACFNEAALITAFANDYGYSEAFKRMVGIFGEKGDLLFAISSSGRSENILRAAEAARKKGMAVVTFSGFRQDNPLRKAGRVNFYVPDMHYSHVEVMHHSLCHYLLEMIMERASGKC